MPQKFQTLPKITADDVVKAFHPQTMGVMYPAVIQRKASAHPSTVTVQFPTVTGKRRFVIPRNHVSVNGVLLS